MQLLHVGWVIKLAAKLILLIKNSILVPLVTSSFPFNSMSIPVGYLG